MVVADLQNLVERNYREGGPLQWVRELTQNSMEARATKIHFGIHWPSVEAEGAYRRMVVDNGLGMSPKEIYKFFREYGGGGKTIGGIHDNFGIGAKSSLLPWNKLGLIVVSRKKGYDPAMIRMYKDPKTSEYKVETHQTDDGPASAILPYTDDAGVAWDNLPSLMATQGTMLVFMGNHPRQHTVLNDPDRDDSSLKAVSRYLNTRYFDFPKSLAELMVLEFNSSQQEFWPKSSVNAQHGLARDQVFHRRVRGARSLITNPQERSRSANKAGELEKAGTIELPDGTLAHWLLWQGERMHMHYFEDNGFIAAVYRNELFDKSNHHALYRSFGIPFKNVMKRLWIILEPKEFDGNEGIYPSSDRNRLLIRGGSRAGDGLPYHDWASNFAEMMPEEISHAISEQSYASDMDQDRSFRDKLAQRLGSRWEVVLPRSSSNNHTSAKKKAPSKPKSASTANGQTKQTGGKASTKAEIPDVQWVSAEEFDEDQRMLAAWSAPSQAFPFGLIQLNANHPVIKNALAHWTSQYPASQSRYVESVVKQAYKEVAASKVAHTQALKKIFSDTEIDEHLRNPYSLTTSLLGYFAEDMVIGPRIKVSSRKK